MVAYQTGTRAGLPKRVNSTRLPRRMSATLGWNICVFMNFVTLYNTTRWTKVSPKHYITSSGSKSRWLSSGYMYPCGSSKGMPPYSKPLSGKADGDVHPNFSMKWKPRSRKKGFTPTTRPSSAPTRILFPTTTPLVITWSGTAVFTTVPTSGKMPSPGLENVLTGSRLLPAASNSRWTKNETPSGHPVISSPFSSILTAWNKPTPIVMPNARSTGITSANSNKYGNKSPTKYPTHSIPSRPQTRYTRTTITRQPPQPDKSLPTRKDWLKKEPWSSYTRTRTRSSPERESCMIINLPIRTKRSCGPSINTIPAGNTGVKWFSPAMTYAIKNITVTPPGKTGMPLLPWRETGDSWKLTKKTTPPSWSLTTRSKKKYSG